MAACERCGSISCCLAQPFSVNDAIALLNLFRDVEARSDGATTITFDDLAKVAALYVEKRVDAEREEMRELFNRSRRENPEDEPV